MDPFTQGTFGGIFSQFFSSKKKILAGTFVGILAGLSPDLDVLIKSSEDPLLSLEYHRQFTHSLIFIPVGAFLVTLFTHLFVRKKLTFFENYIFAIVGYSTHGLLDACTSYGTQLFWPFSNNRIAWNNISIIDPLLTLPILIIMTFTIIFKKKLFNIFGILWIFIYLGFGFYQNSVALVQAKKLAKYRNHDFEIISVKPSFGNLFLWKTIYLFDKNFYVDAVNLVGKPKFCFGNTIEKLNIKTHLPMLDIKDKQYTDIKRFEWFSENYVGYDYKKEMIIDVRYSAIPNEVEGLWGIKIVNRKSYDGHIEWVVNRENFFGRLPLLKSMLFGNTCNNKI